MQSDGYIPERACAPDRPTGNRLPCESSLVQQCWSVPYTPHTNFVAATGATPLSDAVSAVISTGCNAGGLPPASPDSDVPVSATHVRLVLTAKTMIPHP